MPESILQKLYDILIENSSGGILKLIPESLSGDKISEFYLSILQTPRLVVENPNRNPVVPINQEGELIGLEITGKTSAFGLPAEIAMVFSAKNEILYCEGRITHREAWHFDGIEWFAIADPTLQIFVSNANLPMSGSIGGQVNIGGKFRLAMAFPIVQDRWLLQGSFDEKPYPSLSSFFQFVGGINLSAMLPRPLDTFSDISVRNIDVLYAADKKRIEYISLRAATDDRDRPWQILPNVAVTGLELLGMVRLPGDSGNRSVTFEIHGYFRIGQGTIVIGATAPGLAITGRLAPDSKPILLGEIVGLFLGGTIDLRAQISAFDLLLQPEASVYRISCLIDSDWPLDLGIAKLTIEQLGFTIESMRGQAGGGLSGRILLGEDPGVEIVLDAPHPGPGQGWIFRGRQEAAITLGALLKRFLPSGFSDPFALKFQDIAIEIDTKNQSYSFSGSISTALQTPFGDFTSNVSAAVKSTGPTAEKREREYSGHVEVAWEFSGAPLLARYDFAPGNDRFLIVFEDIVGEYDEEKSLVTFRFGDHGLGEVIAMLASWFAPGRRHRLEAPWDILDSIDLKNLELKFDIRHKAIGVSHGSLGLNLGFLSIDSLELWYSPETTGQYEKGVWLALDGQAAGRKIDPWDVTRPETAPQIPGHGNKFFDLRLLALGQHVAVAGAAEFANVTEAIAKIRGLENVNGETIPIGGPGQPVFSETSNWLIATNFGILRFGDEKPDEPPARAGYLVDLSIIFNDPGLYALRLELNGEKAKIFKGLKFEILYKKITDTVGVYQTELTLPEQMRNLDFGAVSLTLPMIGLQVYTNGDFKVDAGFPYNMDFSRSFTAQGIVAPGIPVLGSGGIYFGKLSSATSSQTPRTSKGLFNPVMVFGVGLQLGIGRRIDKGVLKAGFSITIVAVIEGVIAGWHPYNAENPPATTGQNQIQDSYYFWLQGTVGLLGRLYGSVDFAVIKAGVNVTVAVMVRATCESYRAMPLTLIAEVKVAVSLKIGLGLFRITLSFSFSARIEEQVVIGKDEPERAPWFDGQTLLMRQAMPLGGPLPRRAMAWRTLPAATRPVVNLYLAPLLTVAGEDATDLSGQSAYYVASLFIDTADRETEQNPDGDSSFANLCREMLRWLIVSLPGRTGAHNEPSRQLVSRDELSLIYQNLLRENGPAPIPPAAIGQFLKDRLDVRLHALKGDPDGLRGQKEFSAAIFPMPPQLRLRVPAFAGQTPEIDVDFGDFTSCDEAYLEEIRAYFRQLETQVEDEPTRADREQRQGLRSSRATVARQSLAGFVFQDYFVLLARHLVQSALDATRRFSYPLQPEDSIDSILAQANGGGTTRTGNAPSAGELVRANRFHPLTGGKTLELPGIAASVRDTDTFAAIAQRYGQGLTATQLILFNRDTADLLRSGTVVAHEGQNHTVAGGDTIQSLARGLGITVDRLAADTAFQIREKFLRPLAKMAIPTLACSTRADHSDTFAGLAATFGIELEKLAEHPENRRVAGLFRRDTEEHRTVDLPELSFLTMDMIMAALRGAGSFRHLAGMSSRYQMHGLRLPVKGRQITFKHPNPCREQEDCGLFRLTGQQFPLPRLAPDDTFSFSLQKGDDLDWLTFVNPNAAGRLEYVLEKNDVFQIGAALGLALGQGLTPKIEQLGALDNFQQTPRQYNFRNFIEVRAAGDLPLPYMSATDQIDATPAIWIFSEGLGKELSATGEGTDARERPRFSVQLGACNETAATMRQSPATRYGWAGLLEVVVKKLPTPNGTQVSAFTYDLLGTGETGIVLLERLLAAMRGTDAPIDRIFILYRPNPTGKDNQGLQSAGDRGFATFITRSNLSTYTQPVKMLRAALTADEPERTGVLGGTREFVKLLWECSITRSGGFHFYYNEPDNGRGLPENLFDDQGMATLSVLITYAKPAREEAYDLLDDYMNCVVTGDRIDTSSTVVFAQSEVRNLLHTVAEREPLRDIAARYHLTASELAERNRDLPLGVGAILDIERPIYLVRPASRAPGRELAKIAAYFGVAEEAVKALNPGIVAWETLPVFTLLHLPDIRLTVSGDPLPPRRTLSQVAEYYGVSVTTLACANRDREGLFSTGAGLSVPDVIANRVATIPQGNVGLHLVRRNPGEVPEPEPAGARNTAWAPPYLEHCYSLLSYAVVANQYFTASHAGLPVGPDDSPAQNETAGNENPAGMAAAEAPWDYRQVIPIHRFARFNPIEEEAGLPTPEDNIYAGIGGFAQVRFQWRDYFGNETLTPLNMPELDPRQPLNQPPLRIGYTDPLIGFDAWPGLSADYHFSGIADRPVLQLTLAFDLTPYNPEPLDPKKDWRGKAAKDRVVYRKIYYQLHQADQQGNPHLHFRLATSLARDEGTLAADQVSRIKGLVRDIYRYLGQRSEGQEAAPPEIAPISRAIDPGAINPEPVFQLTVTLGMERNFDLIDDHFKDSPAVARAATTIRPQTSGHREKDQTLAYLQFARDFEKIFATAGEYQMKIATGIDRHGVIGQGRGGSLWVVRFGLKAGTGIYYELAGPAVFYGAKPLSTSLVNGTVALYPYRKGAGIDWQNGEQRTYTGIELDTWARQCLAAIDDLLAPESAPAVFLVDRLTRSQHLQRLLTAKKALAKTIAERQLTVMLAGREMAPDSLQTAVEVFRRQLLTGLDSAYTLTAIVRFPVKVGAEFKEGLDANVPPRLYGMPTVAETSPADAPQPNRDYSLSTAKIALTGSARGGNSDLTFVFTSKNVENQTSVNLDLTYRVSHLEHDIRELPGIEDYQASAWLGFINPPETAGAPSPLNQPLGRVTIPVPLKAYPTPPSLISQQGGRSAQPGESGDNALEKLLLWDYRYGYREDHFLQDTTYTQVKFNLVSGEMLRAAAGRDLFQDLAQFVEVYPGLRQDLTSALAGIGPQTAPDAEPVETATAALRSFVETIENIAEAWAVRQSGRTLFGSLLPGCAFTLKIRELNEADGRLRLMVSPEGPLPEGMEPPIVEIGGYRRESAGEPEAWNYAREQDGQKHYLSWREARTIAERTVCVPRLNILRYQNAWSSAFLRRNENLVETPTAEEFIYQTPEVHFADRLIPLLDVDEPIDIASIGGKKPLSLDQHLARLGTGLFPENLEIEPMIQLECRYAYRLQAGLPAVELPVLLLPPSVFRVPTDAEIPASGCPEKPTEEEALVCGLARALRDWYRAHTPSRNGGRFLFDLTIYSNLNDSQMPLVRLRGLFLDIANVSDLLPP